MSISSLTYVNVDKQEASKEGSNIVYMDNHDYSEFDPELVDVNFADKYELKSYLHDLIRAHAKWSRDGYELSVHSLPFQDRKEFLSYILDSYDYKWFAQDRCKTEIAFNKWASSMQKLINQNLSEVYHEDMEEMGKCLRTHSDNGEQYWVRG